MTKVAINGFGRIGRLVARAILERPDCGLELVSVNDLADAKSNAWLFKHDSVHGKFPGSVETDGTDIVVDGKRIHVTAERDPGKLPHGSALSKLRPLQLERLYPRGQYLVREQV